MFQNAPTLPHPLTLGTAIALHERLGRETQVKLGGGEGKGVVEGGGVREDGRAWKGDKLKTPSAFSTEARAESRARTWWTLAAAAPRGPRDVKTD